MCVWGRSSGARRSVLIRNRPIAEIANDTASIASVGPGPIVADRNPAMIGPMITDEE